MGTPLTCQDFPLLFMEPHVMKKALQETNCRDVFRLALSGKDALDQVIYSKLDTIRESYIYFGENCEMTLIDKKSPEDCKGDMFWCFWKRERIDKEQIAKRQLEQEMRRKWREERGIQEVQRNVFKEDADLWRENVIVDGKVLNIRCSSQLSSEYQRYIPGPSSDNEETHLCTLSLKPKETFNLALKFLLKLFQPPGSTRLHVDLDKHQDFDELLTSDFVKNVTSLTVHSDESRITEEQFKFITEKFQKLQNLDMSKAHFDRRYLREANIKVDKLKMQCENMTLENIIRFDCIFISLKVKAFTASNCNLFIKKWLANEVTNRLKTLLIDDALESGGGMFDIQADLERLPVVGPVKYRKGDFEAYIWESKGAEKFDITRGDGKRATICTHKADFMFYVRD